MCFTKIKDTIKKEETLPPVPKPTPTLRREIVMADLYNLLHEKFPDAHIRLSDIVTQLCDIRDINAFLAIDETNRIKYQKEDVDCDDFAFMLLGQFSTPPWSAFAFGFIWTDQHAMNICVDANLEIWLIEPQTDVVKSNLESWQGTKVIELFL